MNIRGVIVSLMLGVMAVVGCASDTSKTAGVLTQAGVKSAGSGMAFLDMCELAGLAPEGVTERYRDAAQRGLSRAYWDAVERQYQASLQDRAMYLPSRDSWIAFDVEPVACEQMVDVAETHIRNYESLAELSAG